ncbi:MAG: hypothetical protein L6Q26_08640, partial [Anaerolineales bacterium]|nr:hypothetical protein [Anaerolineales bacterium]
DGRAYFARATAHGASVDDSLMQLATYHLLGYETEFGTDAVMQALSRLRPYINRVTRRGGDLLEGSYLVNRAFERYRASEYRRVPGIV